MQKRYGVSIAILLGVLIFVAAVMGAPPANSARKGSAKTSESRSEVDAESAPSAGRVHIVKPGDTLYELARANHITVNDLKATNHLTRTKLRLGQRLVLAAPAHVQSAKKKNSKPAPTEKETAVVAPGDSENAMPPSETGAQAGESTGKGDEDKAKAQQAPKTLRYQLVNAGFDLLGVPYRWRGMSEQRGFDCSGLVKKLFDQFQIELPHSAREQFKLGERVAKAELEIGDLVFFSSRGKIPTHVGIYIGDNQFLHAASRARQVIISNLSKHWYTKRFIGARRISDLWKDEPEPPEAKGN